MDGNTLKAYVVGYGSIDALGNNPYESFQNSLNNTDYSSIIEPLKEYPINTGYQVEDSRLLYPQGFRPKGMSRAQKFVMHATNLALLHANIRHSSNVAVIISSTLSEGEMSSKNIPKFLSNCKVSPRENVNTITDMCTYHVAEHWKFHGMSTSVAAACATGLVSIDYAMRILHRYDYVIVGGADAGCYETAIKGFHQIGAISNNNSPFDNNRTGFVMGEGAGVLILQNAYNVEKYGSKVHAILHEPGHASEGLSITSPAEDGRGAVQAMRQALRYAEIVPNTVCAHGTSTPIGDVIEYTAIQKILPNTPIWAPKSKLGHTVGASGILETIHCIEAGKQNIVPHIHNLNKCDFDTNNNLCRENTPCEKVFMNNSFGFGGKNMAQVLEVIS